MLPIASAAQPIYKWQDHKGVVHFSTTPPKEQATTEVLARPRLQKISGNTRQITEDDEAPAREQVIEPIDEEPQLTAEELAYCNSLRGNMAMLDNSSRVRVKNQDGEYEILADTARQREITRIQKLLTEHHHQ